MLSNWNVLRDGGRGGVAISVGTKPWRRSQVRRDRGPHVPVALRIGAEFALVVRHQMNTAARQESGRMEPCSFYPAGAVTGHTPGYAIAECVDSRGFGLPWSPAAGAAARQTRACSVAGSRTQWCLRGAPLSLGRIPGYEAQTSSGRSARRPHSQVPWRRPSCVCWNRLRQA
jgi:hypothetical protein